MGRLSTLRVVDPVLTTISRGYSNTDYIGNSLFPVVSVEKEAGKIPLWGKQGFKLWNTARAVKADSNDINSPWLTLGDYLLTEHDAQVKIDIRETEEAMIPYEARSAAHTANQLLLGIEKEQADIAFNVATYDTANKVVMADDYLNEAAIDPIAYIHAKKALLKALIAKDANTIVMGQRVWDFLKFHPKIKEYVTINGVFQAVASLQKLAELLEVSQVLVGSSMYAEGAEGSETFTEIWGNAILLAYVVPPTGLDRDISEPCFGYTLHKNGNPYSDKYDLPGGKLRYVRSTDNYQVKVVGAESGFLISSPIDPAVYSPS